jgi:hypothetical protein
MRPPPASLATHLAQRAAIYFFVADLLFDQSGNSERLPLEMRADGIPNTERAASFLDAARILCRATNTVNQRKRLRI